MELLVNELNKSGKAIEPWVFDGATIQDLAKEAEYYAQNAPFDLIFIVGGICNITTKDKLTKMISFDWTDAVSLASHLISTMEKAEEFLYQNYPASTFIFCPIPGANLNNVLKKQADLEQDILNEAIWIYNEELFQRNIHKNVYAPNFADPVHRMINGVRRNFLQHLGKDGIHLSEDLKKKWIKKMIKLGDRY